MEPDETAEPHIPQNKCTAASKLRRSGKHCPVCLAPLTKTASHGRLKRECVVCRSHPIAGKHCIRCNASPVWENKTGAACPTCGLHGCKADIIRKASVVGKVSEENADQCGCQDVAAYPLDVPRETVVKAPK